MTLEEELIGQKRESVEDLERIYDSYVKTAFFVAELIRLTEDITIQTQTSWLLKKHLEGGAKLSGEENSRFWRTLPFLTEWESKLHILQSFSFVEMNVAEKDSIECFLRENLGDENKFLRSWAFSGFYCFAETFPEYRGEVERLLEDAMSRESASIKARIRNVIKNGFLSGKVFD